MSNASSLVLLPPRQTAQDPHPTKTKKPASKESFAPKLAQATKAGAATKVLPKPVAAKAGTATPSPLPVKPATPKPVAAAAAAAVVNNPDQPHSEKVPVPTPENLRQANQPDGQNNVKTAAQTVPVPNSGKATAVAQSAIPVEKKAVKPLKAAPVKAAGDSTKPPGNGLNPAVNPADNSAHVTAPGADSDNDSDTAPAINAGFYGSAKVVARGGGNAADQQRASSGADASSTGSAASDAASSAPATVDPQGSGTADISGTVSSAKPVVASTGHTDAATVLNALTVPGTSPSVIAGKAAVSATATHTQAEFVQQNHPTIVSSIQGQLLPNGGSMSIRLNPQELGAVQVTVHMKDGAMTASFETSNENATKVLSRSLGQLKSGLEAAGMSVEKLHVEQAPPKNFQQSAEGESKQPPHEQQQQAQQDQQRRELMQRMLRKIAGGGDPLDLVA